MAKQEQKNINIEIGEKEAEGVYANLTLITHSASEFIIDFARIMPGVPKARVHSRIVMTPQNFKNLQRAIADNIAKYETQFGQIKVQGQGQPSVNFQGAVDEDKKVH